MSISVRNNTGCCLSSIVFWHLVHCCMCGSFSLQSEDVASHFPSPCCNNVLESPYMLSLRNANAGDFSVSRCLTANKEKCAKIE